jgi:hypothetical protein
MLCIVGFLFFCHNFLPHSVRAWKDANFKLYNKFKKRLKKPFYKSLIFNDLKFVI